MIGDNLKKGIHAAVMIDDRRQRKRMQNRFHKQIFLPDFKDRLYIYCTPECTDFQRIDEKNCSTNGKISEKNRNWANLSQSSHFDSFSNIALKCNEELCK